MESENKKEIGVADGKDLEWKFDVNLTQVKSFKELIGLIVMLHVIPNLNSKLGNEEKKFVKACYNGFGFEKNCNWAKVIKKHKENRNLSLTGSVYNNVSDKFEKNTFEKLSEVMGKNNFTWAKIFDMIKKLDSYCYIDFKNDFFDLEDLMSDLREKLKSESKDDFDKFKDDWNNDRKATRTNNRKNWIHKVKLEEKKIIKSREDLGEILSKIKKCAGYMFFLWTEEQKTFAYHLDCSLAFWHLCFYRTDTIRFPKIVLNLLVDLGFSFDYENFISKKTNSNYSAVILEEYEDCKKDPYFCRGLDESRIQNGFEQLVKNFNQWRDLGKSILWFDDKNKKIDFSMLGFKFENSGKIYPIDKKYERGFSEKSMSCVLDKFKNEEKGFCHIENMQFFVYMMCHHCAKNQIIKDELKRKQFYLDLMDVLAKSVGEDSISLRKILNFEKRDFTKQEENDFIKQKNLQGIKERDVTTARCYDTDLTAGKKIYFIRTKQQKITLSKVCFTGYFLDIINQIPNDVFAKKEVKQKIKKALWNMYDKVDNNDKQQIFSSICYVYETYNLDLNKKDIETLLNQLGYVRMFGNVDSYWLKSTFNIIFKNRDKFSLDEKKKRLNEIMELDKHKGLRCLEIILDENIESESNKEIREKKMINQIKKIQKAVKKRVATHSETIIKIQKVFRDFKKRKDPAIKLQTATRKFLARKKFEKLKKNTIKIQKVFRGFSYRKKLNLKERKDKAIKIQTATRKFLARKKLEKLKLRKEKLKSLVLKKPERQNKIQKSILKSKFQNYSTLVKKLESNEIKNTLKIQKVFRGFSYRKKLKQRKKMTKICTWLFVGFVISLVTFMFEMFVFDVAFLSIPSILTLLVAIILIARFLYIDHKFKIFFWKRKPPIENIIDPSIQKENLIFNDKNNLITNQRIGTIPFNPNSITHPINITENNQDSNQKPREEKNIEEGNIIDTTENRSNQINLNNQNI